MAKGKKPDFSKLRTYPISERKNLVKRTDLISLQAPPPPFESPELDRIASAIVQAHRDGKAVIWMMGAHVIKCGLSLFLLDLMRRRVVTHVAGNGAVGIHDFELAMIGGTSEDVPTAIEDGSFGMAEETGRWMNEAIRRGAREGLGCGAALGREIVEDEKRFPHADISVLAEGWRLGRPLTLHVTLGADIIHQHPACDFAAIGQTGGEDFRTFAAAVAGMEEGVFLNFGSAVTGPEVFLKAVSMARNLGFGVERFTAANFDLVDLGDYRKPVSKDDVDYYYRPRKNIVNRPTSLGGVGYHVRGDHVVTIPNLYRKMVDELAEVGP